MDLLPCSTAAERNKQPILEVLRLALPEHGAALEIASGTGQHAAWFAGALPEWSWQPTEADARLLPALAARVAAAGLPNLQPPLQLDVTAPTWPLQHDASLRRFDAIFCANMLHIAPPAAGAGLMQGAARHLSPGGLLITYGPYFDEAPPAPSNLAFDANLRARDADWGIRRLADVTAEARRSGLRLRERHAMPANNLLLVFCRD